MPRRRWPCSTARCATSPSVSAGVTILASTGVNSWAIRSYEIFPEIGEAWKAVHRRGLAGETITADEDRFERADGRVQWLRWEVRPWHAADGTVGGIVIFSEDITQRKQASEALRRSEKKLHDILDFSPDAIFIVSADGSFVYHNRRAEALLGYPAEEFGRIRVEDTVPVNLRNEALKRFRRNLAGEEQFFETRLQRKDGTQVAVEINGMRLPDGTVIGEVRDITERKVAEEALRQALAEQQRGAPGGSEPDGGRPGGAQQRRGGGGLVAQAVDGRRAKPGEHRHHQPRC
jgi:PAS domain S-box-containing protein